MPGIAGVISRKPAAECQRLVGAMVGSMIHEPFYQTGMWSVPGLGVYAGFTALPESFAARMAAYHSSDGATVIVAGECFTDQCTSPAELAKLYRDVGDDFVGQLAGLFSGLVIDHHERQVLLFNDRYGGERIYFHETPEAIYFASEAKALLHVLPELRSFDDQGVAQYLTFGCTLDWRTLFRDIRVLPGGTLWSFHDGRSRKQRYFLPDSWASQPRLTEKAFESRFEDTFKKILPRYVGTETTLGVSLTGGLDTRMIMAALPQTSRPICYTFSGSEPRTLDERLAARVAATCGLEHHVLRIGADFLADYPRYVDRTVHVTDGAAGALDGHEIYLNAAARRLAPVRLTGNFGSEVLRSMSTFKPTGLASDLLHPDFAGSVASVGVTGVSSHDHPVTFAAFKEIPWSLFGSMAAGRSQVTFRTPYLDNEIVALAFRAPDSARHSPAAALRLISSSRPALARIPTDRGLVAGESGPVHLVRRALAEFTFKLDYLHKEGLPPSLSTLELPMAVLARSGVLGLHKFLPYRLWFRRELGRHVAAVTTDPRTARLPYWNTAFLASMAREHAAGRRNYLREINAVLTLEAVDRLLLKCSSASSRPPVTSQSSSARSDEPANRHASPAPA